METSVFHHALKVDNSLCMGCTHCMNVCPTEAIRIADGKAIIYENRCIDCGECFKACPVNAFIVEQDDFDLIFGFKCRVALVPAVLMGQFPDNISNQEIYNELIELGFTHIYEVENGVDILSEAIIDYKKKNTHIKPLISSFCPAVVRLIQVKFPLLTENIMLLKPPLDIAALYYKKHLIDQGIAENEIGIFYITPCAAKIAAVKSPVGEEKSVVDGVINMDFIYNGVLRSIKQKNKEHTTQVWGENLNSKSIQWSLTHGEASQIKGRSLAIDEIHNVIEFLEKIENEEIKDVDFLELRACDESCAGGILCSGNRFLTVERLKNWSSEITLQKNKTNKIFAYKDYINERINIGKIEPRSMLKFDENRERALEKMKKARGLMCFLPAIDCGACGSPTCQSLTEDIAQGYATLSHCVFMQRVMEKHHKLGPDHAFKLIEKIWGKDRLKKDCNKKGAINESI